MTTYMKRTLEVLKDKNILCQVVERYHPKSAKYPFGCKQDLFNIIDLIALDNGVLGIQVCGSSDLGQHKKKIMVDEGLKTIEWLLNGGRLEVWAWRKLKKKRGGKAMYWKPRVIDVFFLNNRLLWSERK